MRILVVGLGSMGKRRIRLLKKISSEFSIIGVDSNKERADYAKSEYNIEACTDLEEAVKTYRPECAVVSTAPISHAAIIKRCLMAGMHVFTELNLVNSGYEENIKLAEEQQKVLFLSSTFLYRDEIEYILKKTKEYQKKMNYCYHVGQYLPDWHPWESFENFFVGKKETNGCREIFAIELPWLTEAFSEIERIHVISGKNTDLSIDYQDNYIVLIQHKTGHKGMFAVDIVSRKAVRNLEIYGEDVYMEWDGTPTGLKEYDWNKKEEKPVLLYNNIDKIEGYSAFVIENAYENELKAFFEAVENGTEPRYSFKKDLTVLEWIDRIEKK